jgi:hypothetical protein
MSKPGKVLKRLCKRLGVRLTVKRGKKRVYKSVKVLKTQCKRKKKKKVKKKRKVKRRRRFGTITGVYLGKAVGTGDIPKDIEQLYIDYLMRTGGIEAVRNYLNEKTTKNIKRWKAVPSLQNLAAMKASEHFTDPDLEKAKYPIDIRRKVRNAALEKEIIPTASKMRYRRQYKKLSPDIIRGSGRMRAHRAAMHPGVPIDTLVRYYIRLEKIGQMMEDDSDSDSGI